MDIEFVIKSTDREKKHVDCEHIKFVLQTSKVEYISILISDSVQKLLDFSKLSMKWMIQIVRIRFHWIKKFIDINRIANKCNRKLSKSTENLRTKRKMTN